jgi:LmeA-like phospholipid-binding
MRKLLIIPLILIVLLVVIDRAGVFVAEREIGTRIGSAYSLPSRPAVSIRGFPFLTQVVSGHYQEIDVKISRASADGVQLQDIDAKFTGVRASLSLLLGQNSGSITADNATGTALIPFSQVQLKVPKGITLSADGGDSLRVAGTTAFGAIKGTARLGVTKAGITVTPEHLSVAGLSAGALAARFTFVIPVGTLPLHLTVSGVHVDSDGLVVTATGHDVQFASA